MRVLAFQGSQQTIQMSISFAALPCYTVIVLYVPEPITSSQALRSIWASMMARVKYAGNVREPLEKRHQRDIFRVQTFVASYPAILKLNPMTKI